MSRNQRKLAHFGAPAVFLLAVTIFVLILRGGFGGTSSHSGSHSSTQKTTTRAVTTSPAVVKTSLYTIRYGDTLGAVAIHFGVTVDDIIALNPGIDPTALRVGQKIKINKARKAK